MIAGKLQLSAVSSQPSAKENPGGLTLHGRTNRDSELFKEHEGDASQLNRLGFYIRRFAARKPQSSLQVSQVRLKAES